MRGLCLTAVVILVVVTSASLALASRGQLEIAWHTVDGGGTTASCGGGNCLSASMGQPAAGASSGGVYALQGGFWAVAAAPDTGNFAIYLPLIRR
jgi:hypothetical protein